MSVQTSVALGQAIALAASADPTSLTQWFPGTPGLDLSPYAGIVTEVFWGGITSGANGRWRWQESNDGAHWADVFSAGFSATSGAAVASGMARYPAGGAQPFGQAAHGRWEYDGASMGPGPASGGFFGVTFFGRAPVSQYQ